jgi:hypothetical protein
MRASPIGNPMNNTGDGIQEIFWITILLEIYWTIP